MRNPPELLAELLLLLPLAAAAAVWVPRLWAARQGEATSQRAERLANRLQDYVTTATSLLSMVLVLVIAGTSKGALRFEILLVGIYLDSLSIYFLLLVNLVAAISSFYIGPYSSRRTDGRGVSRTVFYSLFNLFHFTMILVPMVSNLVILWIGIELTAVTSTALVAAERARAHFEAAWKYIIITSAGIIFALLGTLFLASAIPLTKYPEPSMQWPDLMQIATDLDPNVVRLSFLFIIVGYGAKAGLAPMHTWLPDAHGEAPYPVSALLSGVLLKSAFYVILRFLAITNESLQDTAFTSGILLFVGLLSLLTATPLILKRNPLKRILAYHSLEHMGIITVGIGIGGPIALFGALLHILNHGVTKSLMFLAYGNVRDNYPAADTGPPHIAAADERNPEGRDGGDSPRGVLRAMPWTGSILALGGLALVGAPPFSIFLSEFIILWGGVKRILGGGNVWLTLSIVVFLASVTLIFGGLVRHLGRILLGKSPGQVGKETARQIVPLLVLLVVVIVLGLVIPNGSPLDLGRLLDESVEIICLRECVS